MSRDDSDIHNFTKIVKRLLVQSISPVAAAGTLNGPKKNDANRPPPGNTPFATASRTETAFKISLSELFVTCVRYSVCVYTQHPLGVAQGE